MESSNAWDREMGFNRNLRLICHCHPRGNKTGVKRLINFFSGLEKKGLRTPSLKKLKQFQQPHWDLWSTSRKVVAL